MASTVTAATLTVTLSEFITLAGEERGSTNTLTIPNVTNVSKSLITCLQGAEVGILGVSDAQSTNLSKSYLAGQFDQDDVRYVRITNLDDTNYVNLIFRNSGNSSTNEIAVKLDKGASFIYGVDLDGGTEATALSGTSALTVAHDMTLNNLIDVVGQANTADVELEVFVATI